MLFLQSYMANCKRVFVLFLLSLYVVMLLGFTTYRHLCGGKLVEASLVVLETDQCPNCILKSTMVDDCCKIERETFQIEEKDYFLSQFDFKFTELFAIALPSFILSLQIREQDQTQKFPAYSSRHKTPPNEFTYILNCVYRI